ncbi:MAG: hypothetical protein II359_04565 [Clostridia bacterium]|nr:hypothetical protein [Clostridia bacterium]
MKKKIMILLCVVLWGVAVGSVCTFAAVGDVIGQTTYTDIRAYINHFAVASYNVDGYTVIVAEDLTRFGFDVIWSQEERSLKITRNPNVTTVVRDGAPQITAPHLLGLPAYDILETDIKTYINDVEVPSYNIGGRTVIHIAELSIFGGVTFDQTYRVMKLWITDGLEMRETEEAFEDLPKKTLYSATGKTIDVYEHEVQDYLKVGWYKTKKEAQAIQKAAEEAATIQKNKAMIQKFYVGQRVQQWAFLYTKYGTVQSIDYNTGKLLVYWDCVVDANGYEQDGFSSRMLGGFSEEWVNAVDVDRCY